VAKNVEDYNEEGEDEVEHSNKEGEENMKKNIFEKKEEEKVTVLQHDEAVKLFERARQLGSLKEAVLEHAAANTITNIDFLFPDSKELNVPPEFIKRDDSWVKGFLAKVKKSPFSRIKMTFSDITADAARAKGYVKGALKTEEIITLLKRNITPTTVYKKQKLDRDDIVDITSFDVVSWLKKEMVTMLEEEIARAILLGDGRDGASPDKINETNIIPIYKDAALYTIHESLPNGATTQVIIDKIISSRKDWKGTGTPSLYTTQDFVANALTLKDTNGRYIYDSVTQLANRLRVAEIVDLEVMEGITNPTNGTLVAILVNPNDYTLGADKGGQASLFDDFDIDYNQYKYLIETRASGALTKPASALVFEIANAG